MECTYWRPDKTSILPVQETTIRPLVVHVVITPLHIYDPLIRQGSCGGFYKIKKIKALGLDLHPPPKLHQLDRLPVLVNYRITLICISITLDLHWALDWAFPFSQKKMFKFKVLTGLRSEMVDSWHYQDSYWNKEQKKLDQHQLLKVNRLLTLQARWPYPVSTVFNFLFKKPFLWCV